MGPRSGQLQMSCLYNLQVYTGKLPGNAPEKNLGHCVECDLMEPLFGTGRGVTTDNSFRVRDNCRIFAAEEYYYDRNIESKKA
jgi:hypothetical protein